MNTAKSLYVSQLLMRHPSLEQLKPLPSLPESYVLRPYRSEEASSLVALLQDAFAEFWDETRLKEMLTENESVKAVYVIDFMGRVVATSSACLLRKGDADVAYVHYVGVASDQRGKQLGETVVLRVLSHFRDMEQQSVLLETDDFRTAALRLYLKLGFVPEYRHALDQHRWSSIFRTVMNYSNEKRSL